MAKPYEDIELDEIKTHEEEAREQDNEYRDAEMNFASDFERYRDEVNRRLWV